MISDPLAIPPCLDLKKPEVRTKHDEARRNWKASTTRMTGEKRPRPKTDAKGRALPTSMDDASWALLRSQEKEAKQEDDAAKKVRLDALSAANAEKRALKREARDAKGDAAAKRK